MLKASGFSPVVLDIGSSSPKRSGSVSDGNKKFLAFLSMLLRDANDKKSGDGSDSIIVNLKDVEEIAMQPKKSKDGVALLNGEDVVALLRLMAELNDYSHADISKHSENNSKPDNVMDVLRKLTEVVGITSEDMKLSLALVKELEELEKVVKVELNADGEVELKVGTGKGTAKVLEKNAGDMSTKGQELRLGNEVSRSTGKEAVKALEKSIGKMSTKGQEFRLGHELNGSTGKRTTKVFKKNS